MENKDDAKTLLALVSFLLESNEDCVCSTLDIFLDEVPGHQLKDRRGIRDLEENLKKILNG